MQLQKENQPTLYTLGGFEIYCYGILQSAKHCVKIVSLFFLIQIYER